MDRIQPFKLGTRRSTAKHAAGSGSVKSVLIVPWRDGFCNLALHFHANLVRQQQVLPASAGHFGRGQRGGKHTDRRVDQQAIDPVLRDSQLRVVEVIHVNRDPVGKCSKPGWKSCC